MKSVAVADLIIVGGGPVGLATAIYAARAGLAPLVFEKRRLPLDKACGEGLMPPGVAALEAMGVVIEPSAQAPFSGIRYLDGDTIAEGHFERGSGLGVRRTALVAGLLRKAHELGVTPRYGEAVSRWERIDGGGVRVTTSLGTSEARLLVAADGLLSPLRRAAGLEAPAARLQRFGVRRHFAVAPWSEFVEVHWATGAEAYVTPVGPRRIGVALLWSGSGGDFATLLSRFPELQKRLDGASALGEIRGAGPFPMRASACCSDRLALVGDAAGNVDPLTGEGLSLGFQSARALVETVAAGRPLREYANAQRRLSRSSRFMARILLAVAARPELRRRTVRMLARNPDVFARALSINSGELPLHAVGVAHAVRTVWGLTFANA